LTALVMIVFTVPYLALQPMAAGYALEELVGIPYAYGCTLVTAVILVYTLRGGLRAVAWTDLFQGSVMFVLLAAALFIVAAHHGGFIEANQKVMAARPELFSRPGGLGRYTPGIWFSYMALWFFCDPMFPQLFQRFFSARSERSLGAAALAYPAICTLVFFLPISVGVLGRLSFPDLAGKEADRILPMMLTAFSGDFMASLIIAAGLAALMSTMDSQLLTLSSIFSRDIAPLVIRRAGAAGLQDRLFVFLLSLAGLALALKPPATILQIATQTFTGLAVLFPTVIFGLYFKRVHAAAAIASIAAGEAVLACIYLKLFPTTAVLPVVWVMLSTFGVYLATHLVLEVGSGRFRAAQPDWIANPQALALTVLFAAAMDFWAWSAAHPLFGGLPLWMGYFVLLSVLQTIITAHMIVKHRRGP
jgi:SSS family solute:Na+ symporter